MSIPRHEIQVSATLPHEAEVTPGALTRWLDRVEGELVSMGATVTIRQARTTYDGVSVIALPES